MDENKKGFQIYDKRAAELFDQLEGLDHSDRRTPPETVRPDPEKGVKGQLDHIANYRILMVEIAGILSSYFIREPLSYESEAENQTFGKLSRLLKRMDGMPGNDGMLFFRYRGMTSEPETDYFIKLGNVEVDLDSVSGICAQLGKTSGEKKEKLKEAFQLFRNHGISSLFIELPWGKKKKLEQIQICLRYIAQYSQAVKQAFSFEGMGSERKTFSVVLNERNQPDPNLTILAGLNEWPASKMQKLVHKVGELLAKSEVSNSTSVYLSVYEAIFGLKNLDKKFFKPPVEVNNVKTLVTDEKKKTVSREMALVARLVSNTYGASPVAAQAMESVYGDESVYGSDFKKVEPDLVGKRLQIVSDVLSSAQENKTGEVDKEVLQNVGRRLGMMKDEILEELFIPDEVQKVREKREGLITGTEILTGIENARLKKIVNYYKHRSVARKKMKNLLGTDTVFEAQDYAIIAREFKFTTLEARELIELLRSCFDINRAFKRNIFESHIDQFAQYERHVFEFLWYYLKSLQMERNDRVAFLNSLQLLIGKMKQRKKALRVLLVDVFSDPTQIEYSDRNAMMLANMLLRTYNKEESMDIELTPEEVLQVEKGLDSQMVKTASEIIDGYQEIFLIKLMTIQNKIKKWLKDEDNESRAGMSLKYLLALEKEIYTFFSLIQSATASAVLRIAMVEYGDPDAEIYHMYLSRKNMPALLQRLRLVVRGFGRIGGEDDLPTLLNLQNKRYEFYDIGSNVDGIVNRIMELADLSARRIHERLIG